MPASLSIRYSSTVVAAMFTLTRRSGPVLVADAVDGADAVEDVADGVHGGVLARFQGQTLVAHVLQGDDLAGHFLLGQLFADDVLVAGVVGQ